MVPFVMCSFFSYVSWSPCEALSSCATRYKALYGADPRREEPCCKSRRQDSTSPLNPPPPLKIPTLLPRGPAFLTYRMSASRPAFALAQNFALVRAKYPPEVFPQLSGRIASVLHPITDTADLQPRDVFDDLRDEGPLPPPSFFCRLNAPPPRFSVTKKPAVSWISTRPLLSSPKRGAFCDNDPPLSLCNPPGLVFPSGPFSTPTHLSPQSRFFFFYVSADLRALTPFHSPLSLQVLESPLLSRAHGRGLRFMRFFPDLHSLSPQRTSLFSSASPLTFGGRQPRVTP